MIAALGWPLSVSLGIIAVLAAVGLVVAVCALVDFWKEAGRFADDLAEPGQHPARRPGEWPGDPGDRWHDQLAAMPHVPAHDPGSRFKMVADTFRTGPGSAMKITWLDSKPKDEQLHAQIASGIALPYRERMTTPEEMRWEMQRRSWEIHMDSLIGGTWWRTGNATG